MLILAWISIKCTKYITIDDQYEVVQIKGDRVAIGVNGKVTGAISLDSLY